jgi:hypothetical protein
LDATEKLGQRSLGAAAAEIDRFIERHSRKEDPEEREELWMESVRRYQERERRQISADAEWYGWHCDQAVRHRRTLSR